MFVFCSQLDEDELYHNFKVFYRDVLEEFKGVGQVYQFKVGLKTCVQIST